jgi:hypothetical protein
MKGFRIMKIRKKSVLKTISIASITAFLVCTGGSIVRPSSNWGTNSTSTPELSTFLKQLSNMNLAYANSATATFHITNIIRASLGMTIGFNQKSDYIDLVCGPNYDPATDSCDGPPRAGLVGATAAIVNKLPSVGESLGINRCEDVPLAGTRTGVDSNGTSWTITFETPTHTIPTSWVNAGTLFQKRVTFSAPLADSTAKIAHEFSCGDNAANYIAVNMDVGSNAPNYKRLITLYNGNISGTKSGIEVYMSEYSSIDSTSRASHAVRIEYDISTNIFNLWGLTNHSLDAAQKQLMGRLAITGNYQTGKASVFYNAIALDSAGNYGDIDINSTLAPSAIKSADDLTNGIGGSPAFDFTTNINVTQANGNAYLRQGCIDFSNPNTSPTGTSECPGLGLVSATGKTPYVDSTGSFSMGWAVNTMPTKLEILP